MFIIAWRPKFTVQMFWLCIHAVCSVVRLMMPRNGTNRLFWFVLDLKIFISHSDLVDQKNTKSMSMLSHKMGNYNRINWISHGFCTNVKIDFIVQWQLLGNTTEVEVFWVKANILEFRIHLLRHFWEIARLSSYFWKIARYFSSFSVMMLSVSNSCAKQGT